MSLEPFRGKLRLLAWKNNCVINVKPIHCQCNDTRFDPRRCDFAEGASPSLQHLDALLTLHSVETTMCVKAKQGDSGTAM